MKMTGIKHWSHHRKAQVTVTVAIILSMAAHFACAAWAPSWEPIAPLAGFLANMIWIWVE